MSSDVVFSFMQKTAYEVRISDWSSDVCSSHLHLSRPHAHDFRGDSRAARQGHLYADGRGQGPHDAWRRRQGGDPRQGTRRPDRLRHRLQRVRTRSEEHTSELQSLMRISYAVSCLKKKKNT